MNMGEASEGKLPTPHAGSGTGWQLPSVPGHLWMTSRGGCDLIRDAIYGRNPVSFSIFFAVSPWLKQHVLVTAC
jgi:hypothetical protein